MKITMFKKKSCCCGCDIAENHAETEQNTRIKVLGSGCKKCMQLEENVKKAMEQMQISEPVGHVKDFSKIAAYGVMTTPALVIDEKVVSFGRVLSPEEVIPLLAALKEE